MARVRGHARRQQRLKTPSLLIRSLRLDVSIAVLKMSVRDGGDIGIDRHYSGLLH